MFTVFSPIPPLDFEAKNDQSNNEKPLVNLARMDHLAPEPIRKALAQVAVDDDPHLQQYTSGSGHPSLIRNVARLYSPLINRNMDPSNEIIITSGASEALLSAILGHVHSGDEVIIIEPFFKSYVPMVLYAGGIPRFVPLRAVSKKTNTNESITSADWVLDRGELATAFNSRTKMTILNTPHSPLGKVFSREELEEIAELCRKWNVLCLSDEAFEWMVYDPAQHVRIATLPGMWERTITICSAGKTFLVPGWKVGWAYGPEALIRNMKVVYQNSCCTPLQEAVARLLIDSEMEQTFPCRYFSSTTRNLLVKRCHLANMLRENGFDPTVPEAGYFMVANRMEQDNKEDETLIRTLYEEAGIIATPLTEFYSEEHPQLGDKFVVMCFLQNEETLKLTEQRLKQWNLKMCSSK